MTSCVPPLPSKPLRDAHEQLAAHYSLGLQAQPVLVQEEAAQLLGAVGGEAALVAHLLYATGMGLSQAVGLRIKDVDLDRNVIAIHRTRGGKRPVGLPRPLAAGLRRQIADARAAWEADRRLGLCGVQIPQALQDRYPQAGQGWSWFWLFPSPTYAADALTGAPRRLSLCAAGVDEEIARAARVCGLSALVNARSLSSQRRLARPQAVPPTVSPSMRNVGWPTPTGTLWPSLPQVPTPVSSFMSLPIMLTRVNASGPLPTMVAPFTG